MFHMDVVLVIDFFLLFGCYLSNISTMIDPTIIAAPNRLHSSISSPISNTSKRTAHITVV